MAPASLSTSESTLTSTLSFKGHLLISNRVRGTRAEGDMETGRHSSRLHGVCNSPRESEVGTPVVNQSRTEDAICEKQEQRLQGFCTILYSFQNALRGTDDLIWWSHPDPSSMLWQYCWAQGSSPGTSHAKSTGPDMTWIPIPTLTSHVLATHPWTNSTASLNPYDICEVGWLHLPPSILENLSEVLRTHGTQEVLHKSSYNNVNFRLSSYLYCYLTASSVSFISS